MKTTDLIDMMAQEDPAQLAPERPLRLSALAGVGVSAVLLFSFWGIRPDFSQVISEPLVLNKYALPLLTALPCLAWIARSRQPDAPLHGLMRWLLLPLFAIAALVIASLMQLPSHQWLSAVRGETLVPCIISIPLLATPVLLSLLWVAKRGAPSNPAFAGALCGVAAGCLATSVYALHCFEDNPAFYGIWYSVAISAVGLVGQQIGARWLRW